MTYPLKDVSSLVKAMGGNQNDVNMISRYLWFCPDSSMPTSPVVLRIVEIVQQRLALMGVSTRCDGLFDDATVCAVRTISGPDWPFKNWIQIYRDMLVASDCPKGSHPMSYLQGMGNEGLRRHALRRPRISGRGGYMAMGELALTDWCSSTNAQGNCKAINGICMPMNSRSLQVFKDLQRVANRILYASQKSLIDVDGRIGPQTLAAVNFAMKRVSGPYDDFGSCDGLSLVADDVEMMLAGGAASIGAPETIPDPSSSKPSVLKSDGSVDNSMAKAGFVELLSSPIGLALIGAGVFLALRQKKGAKKKPATRRAPARRRLPRSRVTRTIY